MVRVGEEIQPRAKVGVFGIGLEAYWDQFEGLRDRLEGYRRSVERLCTYPAVVDGDLPIGPGGSSAIRRWK
jgi:hypothetical protein